MHTGLPVSLSHAGKLTILMPIMQSLVDCSVLARCPDVDRCIPCRISFLSDGVSHDGLQLIGNIGLHPRHGISAGREVRQVSMMRLGRLSRAACIESSQNTWIGTAQGLLIGDRVSISRVPERFFSRGVPLACSWAVNLHVGGEPLSSATYKYFRFPAARLA